MNITIKQNEELQTKIDFYDDMSKIIVKWASNMCIEDSKFYEKDFNDKINKCILKYFDMRQINYFKTHNILDYKKE